jgi:hypothetical protein
MQGRQAAPRTGRRACWHHLTHAPLIRLCLRFLLRAPADASAAAAGTEKARRSPARVSRRAIAAPRHESRVGAAGRRPHGHRRWRVWNTRDDPRPAAVPSSSPPPSPLTCSASCTRRRPSRFHEALATIMYGACTLGACRPRLACPATYAPLWHPRRPAAAHGSRSSSRRSLFDRCRSTERQCSRHEHAGHRQRQPGRRTRSGLSCASARCPLARCDGRQPQRGALPGAHRWKRRGRPGAAPRVCAEG